MKIAAYDTDLTNDHWHLLRRFLPAAKKRGRPRTDLREVLRACLKNQSEAMIMRVCGA